MKRLLVLMVCGLSVLVAFTGCQGPLGSQPANSHTLVESEGGGPFPEFLVGRWRATEQPWEFIFRSDGSISAARLWIRRGLYIPNRLKTRIVRRSDMTITSAM